METTCEQCGRFSAEMEDPTFDEARVLPGARALLICGYCAKCNIDRDMLEMGTVQ